MSDDWYKRDVRAALKGMASLTLEECGAYNRVLDYLYLFDGPLDDNDSYIAGLIGCHANKWKAIKAALVAKGRLRVDGGKVDDDRAIVERQARHHIKTERTLAGHKGGVASAKTRKPNGNVVANASTELNQIREDKSREDKNEREKRAHALPPDWVPSENHFSQGGALGFSVPQVESMAEDMRLWAGAKGETKKNWDMAFSGWIRREKKNGRGPGPPRLSRVERAVQEHLEEIDSAAERNSGRSLCGPNSQHGVVELHAAAPRSENDAEADHDTLHRTAKIGSG